MLAAAAAVVSLAAGARAAVGVATAGAPSGSLLFASNADGDVDAYVVAARGGRVRALTRNHDADSILSRGGVVVRTWRDNVFVLRRNGRWWRVARGQSAGLYAGGRRVVVVQDERLLVATTDGSRRWHVPRLGSASVAPDGRNVAFEIYGDSGTTVVVAAVATAQRRRVVRGSEVSSSWSPDGSLLLVETRPDDGPSEYRILDTRSSRPPRLLARGEVGSHYWSPDGRWLTFPETDGDGMKLTVVSPRNGRRWLVRSNAYVFGTHWSPDARRFTFSDHEGGVELLRVADTVTRTVRTLARAASISMSAWSANGRRIALVSRDAEEDRDASISVADVRTGGVRVVVRDRDARFVGWHPSGQRLVFAAAGRIGVVGVDGRIHGTSAVRFHAPQGVVWSPRRDAAAFTAGYGGASVYVIRADGTHVTRLSRRGQDKILAWLPTPAPRSARLVPSPPADFRTNTRTLTTRGPVAAVSADGPVAGVLVAPHELDCVRPLVWRPGGGVVAIGTAAPCGDAERAPYDVALTREAIEWSSFSCGNDCYVQEYSAPRTTTDAVSWIDEWSSDDAPLPPLPPVETRRGVSIIVARGVVRLRRLSDGFERVVAAPGARIFDAELEDEGLFYAFNRPRGEFRGRVVFVPYAELFGGTH